MPGRAEHHEDIPSPLCHGRALWWNENKEMVRLKIIGASQILFVVSDAWGRAACRAFQ